MTTARDVIAALNQRRLLKARRQETPGQLPTGWQRWLDAQPRLDRTPAGAPPQTWVDAFVQRPLRPVPRRVPQMGRLQALGSLLGQDWTPDTGEDRGLRIGVSALDIVLHVVLLAALLWLMYVQFLAIARAPDEDDGAVQVEFIGRGNLEAGGGALAAAGAESAPAAAAAPAQRAGAPANAVASAASAPDASAEVAPPEPAPAQVVQPVQVTEVEVADADAYQLPPPRQRTLDLPQVELREAQPRRPLDEIATVPPQAVRERRPVERELALRVPELRAPTREVEAVDAHPVRERSAPQLAQRTPDASLRQARDIPLPPGGTPAATGEAASAGATPAAAAGGARGTSPSAGQAPAGSGQGARPAAEGGRGVAATGTGAGPGARAAPGGWPGPARSDDWGASNRNVAGTGTGSGSGGRPGLFNDDGSVRLSDEWSQASGVDIDQSGTWLQRPGLEYRGTRFDRYWIPQGTLLQEWVRRGIKRVAIPIPGTKTRLECVVSLLQLGGGCYPVNLDMNEQPATARPPPDVPFKPELQEHNGSERPGR